MANELKQTGRPTPGAAEAHGIPLGMAAAGFFVLNGNALATTTTPTDPYAHWRAWRDAATDEARDALAVQFVRNHNNMPYLAVYALGTGAAFGTGVSVQLFGGIQMWPRTHQKSRNLLPQDLGSAFIPYGTAEAPASSNRGYQFVGLHRPSDNALTLAFGTTLELNDTAPVPDQHLTGLGNRVRTEGVDIICCHVTVAGIGPTSGLVLGRFVSTP